MEAPSGPVWVGLGRRKNHQRGDTYTTFEIQISTTHACSTTWGWQQTSEYLGFCLSLASWSSYPDTRRAKGLTCLLQGPLQHSEAEWEPCCSWSNFTSMLTLEVLAIADILGQVRGSQVIFHPWRGLLELSSKQIDSRRPGELCLSHST